MSKPKNKPCSICKMSKPLDEFHKDRSSVSGYDGRCRSCTHSRQKGYYEKNKNEMRKRARARYQTAKTNPKLYEKELNRSRKGVLKNRYGMSVAEYNKLFVKQSGYCASCGTHQVELKKRLGVDHCHITGKIRGLLCDRCNRAFGLLRDDISVLESLLEYAKKYKNI